MVDCLGEGQDHKEDEQGQDHKEDEDQGQDRKEDEGQGQDRKEDEDQGLVHMVDVPIQVDMVDKEGIVGKVVDCYSFAYTSFHKTRTRKKYVVFIFFLGIRI